MEYDDATLRAVALAVASDAGAGAWADEVADETMARLAAYEDPVVNPKAFVRRVAHNLAVDWWRREPSDGWGEMPASDPGPGATGYPRDDWVPSPSLQVRHRMQVDEVLGVLNPTERMLLVAAAAGLKASEIGERYGFTATTVHTKVSTARRKVRDAFPDWKDDFDLG